MKTTPTTSNIERRFTAGKVELRAGADGKSQTIRGYAAVFDSPSENLGGFVEVIAKGAFDGVLKDDVRALFNHDANLILGRTKSGTCTIGVDETGLWYEINPADTQTARDLLVSLKRGDVDQSSFAFSVSREGQTWDEGTGTLTRTITKIAKLYDVSPVTYPAYPDTEACARTLQEGKAWKQQSTKNPHAAQARARQLALAEAEG